jgi:hypothetical protein
VASGDDGGIVLQAGVRAGLGADYSTFDAGYADDTCVDDLVLASGNGVFGGSGVLPGGGSTNGLPGDSNVEVLAGDGDAGVGGTLGAGNWVARAAVAWTPRLVAAARATDNLLGVYSL